MAEAAWSKFMKIFGSTTAVFYTLLACALIFSFLVLNRALKKFAHHSLDETKKKICKNMCKRKAPENSGVN